MAESPMSTRLGGLLTLSISLSSKPDVVAKRGRRQFVEVVVFHLADDALPFGGGQQQAKSYFCIRRAMPFFCKVPLLQPHLAASKLTLANTPEHRFRSLLRKGDPDLGPIFTPA